MWDGYTDWTNAGSFLMDHPAKADGESLPLALPTGTTQPLQGGSGWREMSSVDVLAQLGTCWFCFGGTGALERWCHPLLPKFNNPVQKDLRVFFLPPQESSSSKQEQHTGNHTERAPQESWGAPARSRAELKGAGLSSLFLAKEEGRKLGNLQKFCFSGLSHFLGSSLLSFSWCWGTEKQIPWQPAGGVEQPRASLQ